jgi:hypothetical protein
MKRKVLSVSPLFGMLVFILLWLSPSLPSFAEIYKWTDKDGNIVFSDTRPAGVDTKKVKVLKERERPRTGEETGKREYRDIEVLLYMKEWNPDSLRSRAYLKSLGVRLIEYDVGRDKSKKKEMARKGGKAVPLIDVEGIIVKGFRPDSIKRAVEKRRNI